MRKPERLRQFTEDATEDVTRSICNAAPNVGEGDVHLTSAKHHLLSKHSKQIAKLVSPSVDTKSTRRVVASQNWRLPIHIHSYWNCIGCTRRKAPWRISAYDIDRGAVRSQTWLPYDAGTRTESGDCTRYHRYTDGRCQRLRRL